MTSVQVKAAEGANYSWADYPSQAELAAQLADDIAAQLNRAISSNGRAIMALSGGSTPKLMFQELRSRIVDWSKVVITLVDERWVDETHVLSNAAFLKQFLLDELPVSPRFVPLFASADSVQASLSAVLSDYCEATDSRLQHPAGFDVVILGMGGDGHTASFFPDADNIAELVAQNSSSALLTCDSPSTQVPRVTWSLPMLLSAGMLALHFTAVSKKAVFERAVAGGDTSELPIRAVIFQQAAKLKVYYAD